MNLRILFLYSFFSLLAIYNSNAQQIQISGGIKEADGKPAGYASVALYKLPDSTQVKATLTNENGEFDFSGIKPGEYYIVASQIGYSKIYSDVISITKNLSDPVHISLTAKEKLHALEEVKVVAQKPFVEQQPDKTVINVESSVMSSGLSITEVLKRSPGVQVDKDGQVKLKGKSGVMVMIDDKPMYMEAAQLGNILKSLSADQVKSIEIMTNPSAKYDAAGNAGVINIKLKKGALEGLNGSLNTSYGQGVYPKASAGINISYKKNKLSLNSGYQYSFKKNLENWRIDRYYNDKSLPVSAYLMNSQYAAPGSNHNVLLNGDYKFDEKNTFLFNVSGNKYYGDWIGGSTSLLYDKFSALSSKFLTRDISYDAYYNASGSLGYKHKFDTTGTEIGISADYQKYDQSNIQTFTTNYVNALDELTGQAPYVYRATLPTGVDQQSVKLDFTKPFKNDLKLETGIKYNHINTNSDIRNIYTVNDIDSVLNNVFNYNESILAGYVMLYKTLKKWKLQAGLRGEQTLTRGVQKTYNQTIERSYFNLFPSGGVTFAPTDQTSYSLQYSRRIDRPAYKDLNPFKYYSDPFNAYAGNSFLLPQYTDNIEFTYSLYQGAITTVLNYSATSQLITDVYLIDPVNLNTFFTKSNLGSFQNMGLAIALNIPVYKWWNTSNYVYGYQNIYRGNIGFGEINNHLFSCMINSTQVFKLPYQIDLEISGVYEAPQLYGLMRYNELWQVSTGIQKKIFKEKATIKLAVTDAFWTYKYNGQGNIFNTQTYDSYKWDNRVVTFTFTYQFGNRFKINTEDQPSNTYETGGKRK